MYIKEQLKFYSCHTRETPTCYVGVVIWKALIITSPFFFILPDFITLKVKYWFQIAKLTLGRNFYPKLIGLHITHIYFQKQKSSFTYFFKHLTLQCYVNVHANVQSNALPPDNLTSQSRNFFVCKLARLKYQQPTKEASNCCCFAWQSHDQLMAGDWWYETKG